ncbi:MAG: [FeFe] hydrogenase H-cluster radical SAM maturase HydE [Desulfovibrio sp.]|uniref:[FeFe] hydrogenase H-cluster radical SAM maturase HydE n=1 Tax=Desulfovibrio sp. TaxID=885 RepID=UPI001A744521|nr:[FeFe] hydrogenase H-cluster radical SAM maturase HydE [Desulfovibrio sp.]MBD5417680.1 [FeFe] hydrogenase H-cluster radical SAM maturase HydE [Desulfovibrio sp.]
MDRADILHLLNTPDGESVRAAAERELLRAKGARVFVRGLIEFSNVCRRNCRYCGLRAQNRALARYTLTQAEVLDAAARAVALGADSIVLQSGEGAAEAAWLAEVVREIVTALRVPVALCVGERPERDYALWRDAGATRYLLKHETADAALYARLHPGHTLVERVGCLRVLKALGYATGTGFMTGLPGQSPESLADDILLARELGVAMCGAGPFIPQAETPLARARGGTAEQNLRVLSVLRLALPEADLPATTALASLSPGGQAAGLRAGANVLMPGFTPEARRADYRIYDHKAPVSMADAARAITGAGRTCGIRGVAQGA